MKIGIITLSKGENYGGMLQNFAVMKAYNSLGHEAVTIHDSTSRGIRITHGRQNTASKLKPSYILAVINTRLKTKYLIKNQRDHLIPSIIRKRKNIKTYADAKRKRTAAFKAFYDNHIAHTNFDINNEAIPEGNLKDFDFFSVGSDQVWNPTYPSTSGVKFLSFTEPCKKLTFAPSFGISELPDYTKEHYAKWLLDFPMLSVREQRGAQIIKELTGKEAQIICDPTLTVTKSQWEEIEAKPDFLTDKPYALTYFLGNESNRYRRYIENIAKEKNLDIINLFDLREHKYYCAGPAEFIYLIHHADAVFTDSFHAAVFSIIFNRDFVVFDRIEDGQTMSSRLKTLLQTYSLEDRMYTKMCTHTFTPADFSETDNTINNEREKALNFLKESIAYNNNHK